MSCQLSKGRWPAERGAALVVALLVFALAAALMVGLQRDFQLLLQRGANSLVAEQVWSYLLGAEALAATALRFDTEQDGQTENPVDDLNEVWAQPPTPYALDEGGWLRGQLEDLQGRLNVNALGTGSSGGSGGDGAGGEGGTETGGAPTGGQGAAGPRFTIEQRMMIRLLQTLDGVPVDPQAAIALTEAIADFIDADDEPRPQGAENAAYRSADLPYLAANRPLASVSELRAVQGMTPEIYRALAPLVTVWPAEPQGLNWRTAPPSVLRSFAPDDSLEPMPPLEAERLLELRTQGAFADRAALFEDPFFAGQTTSELRDLLTDTSSWFLLTAEVEIAERQQRLYSVMQRNGRSISVVYRSDSEP